MPNENGKKPLRVAVAFKDEATGRQFMPGETFEQGDPSERERLVKSGYLREQRDGDKTFEPGKVELKDLTTEELVATARYHQIDTGLLRTRDRLVGAIVAATRPAPSAAAPDKAAVMVFGTEKSAAPTGATEVPVVDGKPQLEKVLGNDKPAESKTAAASKPAPANPNPASPNAPNPAQSASGAAGTAPRR